MAKKKKDDQKEAWAGLLWAIEDEGLEYAIMHKSNWDEIKDKEFHDLKEQFEQAHEALESYIDSKVGWEDEQA